MGLGTFQFIYLIIAVFFIGIACDAALSFPNGNVTFAFVDNINFKVIVRAQLNTWVGIGYGSSMFNVDMNLIELISNSNYTLTDAYSSDEVMPIDDVSLGGTNDLKNVTYNVDASGNALLTYTRALNTGDKYDQALQINQTQSIILAWGPGRLGYHGGNYLGTTMTIANTGLYLASLGANFDFFAFHGIILIILWVPFNFVGYISARFLRHQKWWVVMHGIGSGAASIISIGILAASLYYATPMSNMSASVLNLHKTLGIILLCFIIVQAVLGLINYIFIYMRKDKNDTIHRFKFIHKYIGMSLTFIVFINIITGFMIKWDNLIAIPAVLCAVFLSIIIILEILNFVAGHFKKVDYIQNLTTEINNNAKYLHFINLIELNFEKSTKKYVLYENYVCDVGDFIEAHPGGAHLLTKNLKQDIGRYVTGTQAFSKNFKPHSHNYSTHKHIIMSLAFAEIKDNHGIISLSSKYQTVEKQKINNLQNYINEDNCLLSNKAIIAENVCEFQFTFDQFSFSRILPNLNWMGRHFSVSSKKLNKTRYYSLCLSLNPFIKEKHMALIRNIDKLDKGEELVDLTLTENEMKSNYLCLYIKKYNFKDGLAKHIHELEENSQSDLIIRGPNGVGLNLYENRLENVHVIFAAGTGVIPFLDLVSFTLRYAVHKISSINYKNNSNALLTNEAETFDRIVSDTFQLHLYVSFRDRQSSIFLDVCEEFERLDQKYNLNIFKLHETMSSEKGGQKIDANFMLSQFDVIKESIKQFYLVGPIGYMDDIRDNLISSGIANTEKIFLV